MSFRIKLKTLFFMLILLQAVSSCAYFSDLEFASRFPFIHRTEDRVLGAYTLKEVQRARLNLDNEVAPQTKKITKSKPSTLSMKSLKFLPPFRLVENNLVKNELSKYQSQARGVISKGIKMREDFYPMIREVFLSEGVPAELLSIAHIESGYNTKAVSHAGAVGMWQFMKGTGKHYGLKINFLSDQRKDPVYSSIAAARHLKDLYKIFNDWHLAVAAYNAGSGAIKSAMKRSGAKDFWELAQSGYLKKETQRFVPKVIAVALIDRYPWRYGFAKGQA